MGKILFSLTFATVLLALASSEASAFVYSSFACQAVGITMQPGITTRHFLQRCGMVPFLELSST